MCGDCKLSPVTKPSQIHDIAQDLRIAQLYTHVPVIGVFVMGVFMWFQSMQFKSRSAMLIIGSILLLGIPTIVVSMKYHSHKSPPSSLGNADVACVSITFTYMCLMLLYIWSRVGFTRSMRHLCMPYLTAAIIFCMAYMLGMFGTASDNKKNNYPLMYNVNHLQWHLMGAMTAGFALLVLFVLLNMKYNNLK